MRKNADRVLGAIALPVIAFAAGLLIIFFILDSKGTTEQNNAYIRVINCIISVPATQRTQADIDKCYTTVESEMNIHLQRYESGRQQP